MENKEVKRKRKRDRQTDRRTELKSEHILLHIQPHWRKEYSPIAQSYDFICYRAYSLTIIKERERERSRHMYMYSSQWYTQKKTHTWGYMLTVSAHYPPDPSPGDSWITCYWITNPYTCSSVYKCHGHKNGGRRWKGREGEDVKEGWLERALQIISYTHTHLSYQSYLYLLRDYVFILALGFSLCQNQSLFIIYQLTSLFMNYSWGQTISLSCSLIVCVFRNGSWTRKGFLSFPF